MIAHGRGDEGGDGGSAPAGRARRRRSALRAARIEWRATHGNRQVADVEQRKAGPREMRAVLWNAQQWDVAASGRGAAKADVLLERLEELRPAVAVVLDGGP